MRLAEYGLRRWFQDPLSSDAWVQIPHLTRIDARVWSKGSDLRSDAETLRGFKSPSMHLEVTKFALVAQSGRASVL